MSEHNFEVESGKSIKLLTKNKVCTEDIVVSAYGGSGGGEELFNSYLNEEMTNFIAPKEVSTVRAYLFYKDTVIKTADLRNATYIGVEAFRDSTLEEVILNDDFNIGYENIFGARIFQNTQLVNINSTLGCNITSISPNVFGNCLKLKNVSLPNIYLNGAIQVFNGCSALETVVLKGGGKIATRNFLNCSSLTTLILNGNGVPQLTNIDNFTATPIESGAGYIYVPKALIEQYKVATNWVTFASQFRAIEDYPEICGGAE